MELNLPTERPKPILWIEENILKIDEEKLVDKWNKMIITMIGNPKLILWIEENIFEIDKEKVVHKWNKMKINQIGILIITDRIGQLRIDFAKSANSWNGWKGPSLFLVHNETSGQVSDLEFRNRGNSILELSRLFFVCTIPKTA